MGAALKLTEVRYEDLTRVAYSLLIKPNATLDVCAWLLHFVQMTFARDKSPERDVMLDVASAYRILAKFSLTNESTKLNQYIRCLDYLIKALNIYAVAEKTMRLPDLTLQTKTIETAEAIYCAMNRYATSLLPYWICKCSSRPNSDIYYDTMRNLSYTLYHPFDQTISLLKPYILPPLINFIMDYCGRPNSMHCQDELCLLRLLEYRAPLGFHNSQQVVGSALTLSLTSFIEARSIKEHLDPWPFYNIALDIVEHANLCIESIDYSRSYKYDISPCTAVEKFSLHNRECVKII